MLIAPDAGEQDPDALVALQLRQVLLYDIPVPPVVGIVADDHIVQVQTAAFIVPVRPYRTVIQIDGVPATSTLGDQLEG